MRISDIFSTLQGLRVAIGTTLVITTLTSVQGVAAPMDDGSIEAECARRDEPATESKLGVLLDKLQADYATSEARNGTPERLVLAMDEVIAHSEFRYLLQCREAVQKSSKFNYRVLFNQSNGLIKYAGLETLRVTMPDNPKAIGTLLSMHMQTSHSVAKLLTGYMHELQHVCQAPKDHDNFVRYSNELKKMRPTEAEKLAIKLTDPRDWESLGKQAAARVLKMDTHKGDILRSRMVNEIEAYYQMLRFYSSLVKHSRGLCVEPGSREPLPYYVRYSQFEKALANGTFAQDIVATYIPQFKEKPRYYTDMNSEARTYRDLEDPSGLLSRLPLKKLNPEMLKLIEPLKIRVAQ